MLLISTLRRVLGLRTVISTSAGLAFAAVNFLALVEVASYLAGDSAWLAILTAGVLILLAGGCFSELNGTLPSAAGIRLWTKQGIGDRFSLSFTLLYLVTVLAVIAADSFILAAAIHAGVPQIPGILWILAFLSLTLWGNLRGVKVAGRIQDTVTYTLIASLIVISAAALIEHRGPFHFMLQPHGNFLEAVAVGVFVFVGFEWVTPLAEEFTDARVMPKGMFLAIGLLAVTFGLFTLAMTHLLPASRLQHTLIPQLLVGQRAFGAFGFWWMLVLTAVTAGNTFNGAFVSASRLLYAMARERTLPPVLGRLNGRFAPRNALLALFVASAALASLVFLTRQYTFLIYLGSTLEAAMYVIAAIAVLGLRARQPGVPRSFRLPGGKLVPILTMIVFAALGLGVATAPDGIPGPVPWTLVIVAGLWSLSFAYVGLWVPRVRARRRTKAGSA